MVARDVLPGEINSSGRELVGLCDEIVDCAGYGGAFGTSNAVNRADSSSAPYKQHRALGMEM